MKLIERINEDFRNAYKNKEIEKKDFLGLVRGESTKQSKEPSDSEVVKVLKAFEKSLSSVIDANSSKDFGTGWSEKDELFIVQSYLPKQMSESDIQLKIEESIASGAKNIGQIMGAFKGLDADMRMVKEKADLALSGS